MPFKDPESRRAYQNAYMRRRYAEDPEHKAKHVARIRKNDARYRVTVDELISEFRNSGCALCKEDTAACLSAHHIDPSEKDFNIGDGVTRRLSPARMEKELSKCECVCHNCHSKIHANLITLLDKNEYW